MLHRGQGGFRQRHGPPQPRDRTFQGGDGGGGPPREDRRIHIRGRLRGVRGTGGKDGGLRRLRRGTQPLVPPRQGIRDGGRYRPRPRQGDSVRRKGCREHPRMGQAHSQHTHTEPDRPGRAGWGRRCDRGHQHSEGHGHIPRVRKTVPQQQVRRPLRTCGEGRGGEEHLRPLRRGIHPADRRRRHHGLEGRRPVHNGGRPCLPGRKRHSQGRTRGLQEDQQGTEGIHDRLRLRQHRQHGRCGT